MITNSILYVCSLLISISVFASARNDARDGVAERQIDRVRVRKRLIDVEGYKEQIRQSEHSLTLLKKEKAREDKDKALSEQMGYRITLLENKLTEVKNGVTQLEESDSSTEIEALKNKVESKLADIQANLYRTKAE